MTRTRILLLSNWYAPGFKGGGSQFAATNLVHALGDQFEFHVLTRNRDLGDVQPYAGVAPGKWTEIDGGRVRYLSPAECRYSAIAAILKSTPHDLLHLNSVVSLPFSAFPAFSEGQSSGQKAAILVSPHGEMAPQALAQKGFRKSLYLAMAKRIGLFRRAHWHAASCEEENDIRNIWGRTARVTVAPLLLPAAIASSNALDRPPKTAGTLRLVFLSRIDRMKNLHLAIDMVARVPGATLDIYGPVSQADYWGECNAHIEASGRVDTFRYCGGVPPADVIRTLSGYDAMLLPSQSENFGYVILESLAAGCPVVTSDKTPWHGLEQKGIGFGIALDRPLEFQTALERLRDMNEAEHGGIRANARTYAWEYWRNSPARSAMIALYDALLQR